jgi:hypothetical protein
MDPRVGRFDGMDPFLGTLMDPITLHPFLYAGSNPTLLVDPTGRSFSSVSVSISNFCMNVLTMMATSTPRLFLVSVTGMRVVAQVAQMLNDEFSSGGAVSMNPTSMLTREGVEIANTVANVRSKCAYGQCAFGVDQLIKKLAELFPGLRTRQIMMGPAGRGIAGRGTFRVTPAVQRRVAGAPDEWMAHVATEIEGGQIVDPALGMVFESRQAWKEFVVGLENVGNVLVF